MRRTLRPERSICGILVRHENTPENVAVGVEVDGRKLDAALCAGDGATFFPYFSAAGVALDVEAFGLAKIAIDSIEDIAVSDAAYAARDTAEVTVYVEEQAVSDGLELAITIDGGAAQADLSSVLSFTVGCRETSFRGPIRARVLCNEAPAALVTLPVPLCEREVRLELKHDARHLVRVVSSLPLFAGPVRVLAPEMRSSSRQA